MIGGGGAAGPSATQDLVQTQQVLAVTETAARTVPTINGVGYAVVSAQNGKSLTHRRLLAIRAARLEAMRELTEKVHGLRIDSQTSVADAVVQSDTLRASVAGTIRGARTVRIEPKGSDTYEVLLEIDREMIDQGPVECMFEYLNEHNAWVAYDTTDQAHINQAFNAYRLGGPGTVSMHLAGRPEIYRLNFAAAKQTNMNSNTDRSMRRR